MSAGALPAEKSDDEVRPAAGPTYWCDMMTTAFVKKPALLVGDLVTFEPPHERAGMLGRIELLSIASGSTLADVRVIETGELYMDVSGREITRHER